MHGCRRDSAHRVGGEYPFAMGEHRGDAVARAGAGPRDNASRREPQEAEALRGGQRLGCNEQRSRAGQDAITAVLHHNARRTHGCGRDYRFRRTRIVLDAERLFGELDAVQHDQLRQYLLDALYRRERQLTERMAHARAAWSSLMPMVESDALNASACLIRSGLLASCAICSIWAPISCSTGSRSRSSASVRLAASSSPMVPALCSASICCFWFAMSASARSPSCFSLAKSALAFSASRS